MGEICAYGVMACICLRFVHNDCMTEPMPQTADPFLSTAQAGQLLARGVSRHLRSHDFVCVEEVVPTRGLRVDVMALGPKGEVWIVECKSSRADFTSDTKWQGYPEWCDRYFFAVDQEFPVEILPDGTGLILADSYDAEIVRMPDAQTLAPARRKKMHMTFARTAAQRLAALRDPRGGTLGIG